MINITATFNGKNYHRPDQSQLPSFREINLRHRHRFLEATKLHEEL